MGINFLPLYFWTYYSSDLWFTQMRLCFAHEILMGTNLGEVSCRCSSCCYHAKVKSTSRLGQGWEFDKNQTIHLNSIVIKYLPQINPESHNKKSFFHMMVSTYSQWSCSYCNCCPQKEFKIVHPFSGIYSPLIPLKLCFLLTNV